MCVCRALLQQRHVNASPTQQQQQQYSILLRQSPTDPHCRHIAESLCTVSVGLCSLSLGMAMPMQRCPTDTLHSQPYSPTALQPYSPTALQIHIAESLQIHIAESLRSDEFTCFFETSLRTCSQRDNA